MGYQNDGLQRYLVGRHGIELLFKLLILIYKLDVLVSYGILMRVSRKPLD